MMGPHIDIGLRLHAWWQDIGTWLANSAACRESAETVNVTGRNHAPYTVSGQ